MKVSITGLLLINLAWLFGCLEKTPKTSREIVARVNNEPITVAELLALSSGEDPDTRQTAEGVDQDRAALQQALLDHLIEKKMLLQEAKRLKIVVSNAELESKISELKAAMDERVAKKFMHQEETELRKNFETETRNNLLIEKLLRQLPQRDSSASLEISEEAIQDYYDAHPDEWRIGEERKLRQIVSETKEEAEAIYLSILDGADFEETAKKHAKQNPGDGGELGYLQKQATPVEFDSLFRAEIGEISPVIKTEFGYHIVKVEGKRPARIRSLKEVRDTISRILYDQKREEIFGEWMTELKQRTEVKIDEAVLKKYS